MSSDIPTDNPTTPRVMTDDSVMKEPLGQLNTDPSTWEGMFNAFLLWAAKEPWTFLYYVFMALSPFFALSAIMSYKLSKAIEKQEKNKKKKLLRKPHKD